MTGLPSLSSRLGRALIDRFIDETARGSKGGDTEKLLEKGIADHLEELIGLGVVRRHDSIPNRRVNIVAAWNGMSRNDGEGWLSPETQRRHVAERIFSMLVWRDLHSIAWKVGRGEIDAAAREKATVDLEACMDSGTSDLLWAGEDKDFVSGEDISFVLSDWNLVVGRRIRDWRNRPAGSVLEPIEDLEPVRLHQVEIDVPSGRLLIAEWFHVDGFTDLVDEGDPWRGGSHAENESDAERYVSTHGFVSVSTARRCLTVFRKGDTLGIGHHDEDGDHPKPKGCRRVASFMVDLRKVTMSDRSVLVDVLRKVHPDDDVEAMVANIERDRDMVSLKVAPGRYRISSSGRGHIEDLLHATSPFAAEGFQAVTVIERIA
jgi:hypothetical protein